MVKVAPGAWDSPTGVELDCIKLVDPDTFCGGKVFSKNLHHLHHLHPPKLSGERSSFEVGVQVWHLKLHPFCTICTICPRWRESDPLLTGSGFRIVRVKRVPVSGYRTGYIGQLGFRVHEF